jgi:hypothetical protein
MIKTAFQEDAITCTHIFFIGFAALKMGAHLWQVTSILVVLHQAEMTKCKQKCLIW